MLIRALLPHIHRRPTGGNLFNRHLLAWLEGVADVDRHVVAEDGHSPDAEEAEEAGVPDLTLVDSLLLDAPVAAGESPRLLLAHYLHLFDPRLRRSREAERERHLLAELDGVLTTSRYCRDVLIEEGWAPERVAAVDPGLAAGYFAPPPARPTRSGPLRLLTVATLLDGKGLRSLLGVLESLDEGDWTWEVAGDPDLDPLFAARFRQRVGESKVAERVHLLGAVDPDRMPAVYDRASVFVLPSRFETCSIATMEAMARGLPVVAYRVGGIPERVAPASAELLASPGDERRLGEILRRLLRDPVAVASHGRESRRAARSFPTWERCGATAWDFLRRFPRAADQR